MRWLTLTLVLSMGTIAGAGVQLRLDWSVGQPQSGEPEMAYLLECLNQAARSLGGLESGHGPMLAFVPAPSGAFAGLPASVDVIEFDRHVPGQLQQLTHAVTSLPPPVM